jgi:hypothetical protein
MICSHVIINGDKHLHVNNYILFTLFWVLHSFSEALSPLGYNDLQMKDMKDMPSSFIKIRVHRNSECSLPYHSHICISLCTYEH